MRYAAKRRNDLLDGPIALVPTPCVLRFARDNSWGELCRTHRTLRPHTRLQVCSQTARWSHVSDHIVKPPIGIIDTTVKSITLKVGLFLFCQSV